MAEKDSLRKSKVTTPKKAPKSVEFNMDGNVDKSVVVVGDGATINYHAAVAANTQQNDPDFWNLKHPYPMPPNFTGRLDERAMLTQWLDGGTENRLFILRALGGFGKSALAWQWLTHDVNPKTWKKVVFWSFYEGDASFDHFVEETLKYLNLEVSSSKRNQVDTLLRAMQADNILLIMDGFERALRAYSSMNAAYQGDEEPKLDGNQLDCVDINAEWFLKGVCALPNMKSKVLMTTRLTPRVVLVRATRESPLQGCHEVELTAMQKADAVQFFYKQGVKGNRVEIESACEPYGYHPLSLRLLAGRILKDFDNPGDISVAQKLKVDGDIIQQKHHVLEVSYNSLPQPEQKLLSTIACFRSPVEMKTLEEINVGTLYIVSLQDDLRNLIDRGLLHFDAKTKKFDLHPIVRRYSYDRLTATDRTNAHERLVNYFEAVPKPEKVEKLEDLAPVIELYHHMVKAGNLDEAAQLFYDRLHDTLYYQFGAYQLMIELASPLSLDGEDNPPRLKNKEWQAWSIVVLANSYAQSGQPRRAVPLLEMHNTIYEKADDKSNFAITLGNAANTQMSIGALMEAEHNLRHSIDLCRDIADEGWEAIGHVELGRILYYRGMWNESEKELLECKKTFDKYGASRTNYVSVVRAYLAQRCMLINKVYDALNFAKESLNLAVDPNRSVYGGKQDIIRAYWLLGGAYRANNELTQAEENLSKALNISREINNVENEADILLDVARLRYAQGDFKDAQEKAFEALVITERCGYVLQGADVNLFLAQYALEQEKDKAKAKDYAGKAKELAYCDGGDYKYKVAYEEAEAMLEKLKE